ncbi:MAG: CoA-binding protein, partial [Actinomycetota bacterium]
MTRPLTRMLEARSVAVVGASLRPGSFGEQLMAALTGGGYEGDVYPVNPRYEEVAGRPCHASLHDVPGEIDLVLLAVPSDRIEEQLEAAVARRAGAAVVYAGCYEEPRPGVPSLTERLEAVARGAGIPLCGGNCMGFLNLENRLRACGYAMPGELPPGSIAFISHSGSAFAAMAYNDRRLLFNLLVSSGQELVTTMADYLHHALDLPTTKVVGLFIEAVRDPARFRSALDRAAGRDVPVVAIKVGRQERAAQLAETHSGALAGEDAAYEALFDAHGVSRVATLDEMADTLELFATGRRAARGGLASVHDSGGERALLVDVAAERGVPLAGISSSTRARMQGVLEEGLVADNPLDAWGTGNDYEPLYVACLEALLDDPEVAAVA